MDTETITRREFITATGKCAITAAVTVPIMKNTGLSKKNKQLPGRNIMLDLKAPGSFKLKKIGGALKIPDPLDTERPIIVTRISENVYAAFSSRCTHLGCEVPLPVNGVITCECHNSKFDISGKLIRGPAKKDLNALRVTHENTVLVIRDGKK